MLTLPDVAEAAPGGRLEAVGLWSKGRLGRRRSKWARALPWRDAQGTPDSALVEYSYRVVGTVLIHTVLPNTWAERYDTSR